MREWWRERDLIEHEYVFENEFEIGWKNLAWSLESKESKVFNISPIEVIKQKKYQNGHCYVVYKFIIFICLDNKDLLLLVEDSDRCMLYITKYVR